MRRRFSKIFSLTRFDGLTLGIAGTRTPRSARMVKKENIVKARQRRKSEVVARSGGT